MAASNEASSKEATPGTKAETEAAVGKNLPVAGNDGSVTATVTPDVEEAEKRPALKDLTSVEYIGTADVKSFSVEDLARVGVTAKGDLQWSADNERSVDIGSINAETADWLATQEDFRLN